MSEDALIRVLNMVFRGVYSYSKKTPNSKKLFDDLAGESGTFYAKDLGLLSSTCDSLYDAVLKISNGFVDAGFLEKDFATIQKFDGNSNSDSDSNSNIVLLKVQKCPFEYITEGSIKKGTSGELCILAAQIGDPAGACAGVSCTYKVKPGIHSEGAPCRIILHSKTTSTFDVLDFLENKS